MKLPIAKKISHETHIHGYVLQDPYYWMRDRKNPEVIDYLKSENIYTEHILNPTKNLQGKLYQEMLSRIKETDLSVPYRKGPYYYYSRTEKGKQYSIYCRKHKSLEAPEEVILDENELAKGNEYFDIGVLEMSPDHKRLAYSTDTKGDEIYTLLIKDLSTDENLKDEISNIGSSVEWAEDNVTIFYNTLDEAKRPYKLFRHKLGEEVSLDKEIYHEKDQKFSLSITKTKNHKYLILDLNSKTSSEVHYLRADTPLDKFKVILPREKDHEYSVEYHGEHFFILTNDQAKNFKLVKTPIAHTTKEHWEEVVSHRKDVLLDDFDVFRDFLVLYEREDGLPKIKVYQFSTRMGHYLAFDEAVYSAWEGNNPEFDSQTLRFGYSSLITPSTVYDYDMVQKTKELKKKQEVLGGYDPALYQSERMLVRSHDGKKVPLSVVYKKGLKKTGDQPCYLYGYGSYGIIIEPVFSSNRLSLLDRGFVFAIAHIRGGEDLGRPWYEDGKLQAKKNSFLDFIACAEYLIDEKYTSKDKLIISGGSAGGLLMGSVTNARPDLYKGVIMHVPFVDVVNTMLDATLPLTVTEYEEWGNPNEKLTFDYIRSYSPYDNIQKQRYPNIFVTGGLNDPRVQYWEPAKWTAKLRDLKTDKNLLLLKTHMGAGHSGPSGRYDYLREIAIDYAFIFHILGIKS